VQPFPELGGKRYLLSNGGGRAPEWRRDGKELYYVAGDGRLTAVPLTIRGSSVELGRPESLFSVSGGRYRAFVPSHDGQRFLVATPEAADGAITVLLNWRRVMEK
jgi:hypothetical protein